MASAGDVTQDTEEERLLRELEIQEAILGPDDPQVAATLHKLGVCLRRRLERRLERQEEAEDYLKRALSVLEAKGNPDDLQFASTLFELAVITRLGRGRGGNDLAKSMSAEELFRRASAEDPGGQVRARRSHRGRHAQRAGSGCWAVREASGGGRVAKARADDRGGRVRARR